ncbi:MAG: DUF4388 domain-containing protein [Planctomycetota bacterium]
MAGKSFKGNLEVLNLSDIFQSLAMNRHSGTLVVNDGKREKKIFFAEGEICLLTSGRRMRLGDLLVSSGKITSEDLDLALKLQKQSRKRLGEILVEEGFCEEGDVEGIVRMQVEEELYDLFLWRKAEFEFMADQMPDDMAAESPNLTRLNINTNSLIMEALRRLDEWTLIQDAVPSVKEVFLLADQGKLHETDVPEIIRAKAPETIDAKTTVMGLAERWFMSEFECCQHLANLVKSGAIRALTQEELADKAEAAYALNDFHAAAALYGRLAEYHENQPKILIPLADSLRRTGGERLALTIYEELSQQLERDGRDPDRLRQCYEAIIQLDPARHDLAAKIEELDLRLAAGTSSRKLLVPLILAGVAVLAIALGAVFREDIARALGGKRPLDQDDEVVQLLDAMTRAEKDALPLALSGELDKADERLAEWHRLARKVWTDYPTSKEFTKVELPVLVSTVPPGFAIYLRSDDEYYQGTSTLQHPSVLCKYRPVKSPDGGEAMLTVKVYDSEEAKKSGVPPRQEVEIPAGRYTKPLTVAIYDKPQSQIIVDGWVDAGGVVPTELSAVLFPSREGKLRVLGYDAERMSPLSGWDAKFQIGEPGDPTSGPLLFQDNLLVGVVEQGGRPGVLHMKIKAGEAPVAPTLRYTTDDPVLATPAVLTDGEPLVVAATIGGEVHGFALAGDERWKVSVDGPVRQPLLVLPGAPPRVLVLSDDGFARALTSQGHAAWSWGAPEDFDGPPVLTGDEVLIPLLGGKLVALSARDGAFLRDVFSDPSGKLPAVAGNDEAIYIATRTGEVRALSGKRVLWSVNLKRTAEHLPHLLAAKDRIYVAFDGPEVISLEPKAGRIAWMGRFPQQGRTIGPLLPLGDRLVVTTSKNLIYLFQGAAKPAK